MKEQKKQYIAIDLKSFYASVECVERGLNPLTVNLVVADESRTDKTICLAVTPALKAYGIPGRARLYQVKQKVGSTVDYIIAPPRMALYIEYSTKIYNIYLKYISPKDIHVYSIDEVFIDVTGYLETYKMTPKELAMQIIQDVLKATGITATAGIGPNLYLAKIAMDVGAKHIMPDKDGVRIAQLDEFKYREKLWGHKPITDFWRVGKGYAKKLEAKGIYTMGDVARCSVGDKDSFYNEDLLYELFGKNAEFLIDHAWGYEPCTMEDIKEYKPSTNSIGTGQVLQEPYTYEQTKLVVREMADLLVLELVENGYITDKFILTIGYDIENLTNPRISKEYLGEITKDAYGRNIPKHARGTASLKEKTSSTRLILEEIMKLFERIIDKNLLVRRINISANNIIKEENYCKVEVAEQIEMFKDYEEAELKKQEEMDELEREKKEQEALINIRKKFGKNAILKGMNLTKDATAKDKNDRIGGHKA